MITIAAISSNTGVFRAREAVCLVNTELADGATPYLPFGDMRGGSGGGGLAPPLEGPALIDNA